jgi:hypothetical protein
MASQHKFVRVTGFKQTGDYSLLLTFNDGLTREIDFLPALKVLKSGFFRPLLQREYFRQVKLNEGIGIIEWPNEADFNPANLHDWPQFMECLRAKYPEKFDTAHAPQLAAVA